MTTQEREDGPSSVEENRVKRTPLPKLQLLIVFLIQFAEPLTATVIYPFVNQFVRETGITGGDETKTGYYAGIVESTFFFSEAATVFAWGWLSDLLGRKPILILGPLGLSLSMLGFGLSTTFWPLVYFRAFQGSFNGNIGVSKSVLAEITDSTNIGDAYALSPLMWSAGSTLGPSLGGVLSNPAKRWPETFGKFTFFHDHPFFLPCAAAAFIAFTSFSISSIALKETLPTSSRAKLSGLWRRDKRNQTAPNNASTTPLLTDATSDHYGSVATVESAVLSPAQEERPPLSRLFAPSFVATVANYGLFAFVDMSMSALIPLVYSTPIQYGGLGMDPFKIGTIMGIFGFLNGLISGLFLGSLITRYGVTKIYKTGIWSFFFTFSAFPIANALARRAGGIDAFVVLVVLMQFAATTTMSPCYASMGIMVIQNCPSKLLIGSANGAAQMVTSGSRALAPAIASSLFSVTIQHNLLNGHAVYYIFLVLAAIAIQGSHYLPSPALQRD